MNKGNDKTDIKQISISGPESFLEIKKRPFMGYIIFKAFLISPFRSNSIADDAIVNKTTIIFKNFVPDKKFIADYRKVCFFAENKPDIIPISYVQTIFTGLLGKFITSSFFPINPLGLIHIFQSFKQAKSIKADEVLDLSCTLESIKKTDRGIETTFNLKAVSDNELVWQGISIFLTRKKVHTGKKEKKSKAGKKEKILSPLETISVPPDIGRKYARVSGDYNPYHLYSGLAKIFGFKSSIAHGMWSLARAIASLDRQYGIDDNAAYIEASFKLPIFIPAKINLGYEEGKYNKKDHHNIINFELRDEQSQLPHLKGKLILLQ